MISAASALSGFDLPARRSKNRSQSQKCVLRVFLRASASPRQEASLNPPPNPESRQHKFFFLSPTPIPPTPLPAPPPSAAPPIPSTPAVPWNQGANPLTVAGPVSGPFVARFSDLSPLNSFIINKRVRPSGPRMARFARTGVLVNEPQTPSDPRAALDLGRLLGQRRAFGAVAGRCSAAHAQLLRRMRDEKLYLPLAPSWRDFCGVHLAISRRHADRLIGFLNRFGPIYFELSQLIGISPQQYLAIEPAVREDSLVVNGEAVSLIPENAPKLLAAAGAILHPPRRNQRPPRRNQPPARSPEPLRDRVPDLTSRGRAIANQFVALYNSAHSARDREFILEAATELRMMLRAISQRA